MPWGGSETILLGVCIVFVAYAYIREKKGQNVNTVDEISDTVVEGINAFKDPLLKITKETKKIEFEAENAVKEVRREAQKKNQQMNLEKEAIEPDSEIKEEIKEDKVILKEEELKPNKDVSST